ncbi:MAG: 3-oxoacyl-[acyl-carrier-protein] synthase-3 [Cyclobacteriaceae bacterium]|jgi:3-oxoacyl-[acyl-carrier-protein] synthase-3
MKYLNSVIKSTGCYLPKSVIKNAEFVGRSFLNASGIALSKPASEIVQKLQDITQIKERRYEESHDTSFMATQAALNAFENSGIEVESLGGIIIAHNFGNIGPDGTQGHMIPNLAAKVKHDLGIKNARCFAFDVLYGCPGWLLAMNQAHQSIQLGAAKSVLVIGVESLSRVVDHHDVDAMLFGDGAGAAVLVAEESNVKRGILGYDAFSDCGEEVDYLRMDAPRYPATEDTVQVDHDRLVIQMTGRSVFKYAVNKVPQIITESLQSLNIPFKDISKFLFHQANGKMLDAIGQKLCELNNAPCIKEKVPLTLNELGNTSVATIPTMIDLINRGKIDGFEFSSGEKVVMASVGAGMHANCLVYQY